MYNTTEVRLTFRSAMDSALIAKLGFYTIQHNDVQ